MCIPCHLNCLYSLSQVILKLSQSVRGYSAMFIEVKMHVISCNSGHIYMFLFCVMCRCLPSLAVRCVSGSTLLHTASFFGAVPVIKVL